MCLFKLFLFINNNFLFFSLKLFILKLSFLKFKQINLLYYLHQSKY